MKKKKILVILGGNSKEREISLDTGNCCIKALKKLGHTIKRFDTKYLSLDKIKNTNVDLVFNALHGRGGEDGTIQSFLEFIKIPYTHSGVISSMIAMNKNLSKKIFIKSKIKTPNYFLLNKKNYYQVSLKKHIRLNKLKFPIVVKPNNEGSSIGVRICKTLKSLNTEFLKLSKLYEDLIFETFIPGKEIQVALMGKKAIGAIELRPKRKFYDYKAKYKKSSGTLHLMPAQIPQKSYKKVLNISQKAVKLLNCRGITRCDFRFYNNQFFLLEVNTQPGMTNLSLVPEIAKYAKISFPKLVQWIVNDSSINR